MGRALGERAARIPDAAWLTGIVVVSVLGRLWLVHKMPGPYIFVDELIYSELAKSLVDTGSFAVRGVPVHGYSILYPALIAPAYWLFDALPNAYAAAKATNAIAMSLAAVPAWLLARRVMGRLLALLAAVIAIAVPSMAYTATIVTENLFYPVALLFVWALVLVLERPSLRRTALLGVVLVAAVATRSQALGFVAAAVLAPFLLALLRWDARVLRPFLPLVGGAVGLVVVVLAGQLLRGGSISDLLGAYSVVGEGGYDVGQVLRFWLWHVEVVTLYVCVIPVVALVVLLFQARRLAPALQAHLAATLAIVATSTLVVAAFASRFASDRVQDRYLFFLAPLLAIVLLAWVELGAPRPVLALGVGAVLAVGLVTAFPYHRFVGEPAKIRHVLTDPAVDGEPVSRRRLVPADGPRLRARVPRPPRLRPGAACRRGPARAARAVRRPLAAGLGGAARSAARRGGARCSPASAASTGTGSTSTCTATARSPSSGPGGPTASPSTRTSSSTARSATSTTRSRRPRAASARRR